MEPTERVPLGRTQVVVTRLGLGTAPIGGLYDAVSEGGAHGTLARSWELGLRLFDTAPLYGNGLAERRLGAFLAHLPQDELVVATKVGRLLRPGIPLAPDLVHDGEPYYKGDPSLTPVFDFSSEGIRRSLVESLERMGLDSVDLVHIHDPDLHFEEALAGAYPALRDLREEGVVGAIGVGMNQTSMLCQFAREADFDCFLLAGRYTLLDQVALDELLPLCLERNIAVINAGVYNSGILGDPRPGARYDYIPAPQAVLERARAIADICRRHGTTLQSAAIQFSLHHPAVAAVLIGARSLAEIEDNVQAFRTDVPTDLWAELRAEAFLRPDAPAPDRPAT
jgi:aryl-alcohol dehydrogenase-like predicted oxidoreductase